MAGKIKKKERHVIEKAAFVIVFVVLFVFMAVTFVKEREVVKAKRLYSELTMLRNGINTFKIMEKKNPDNLIELASSIYTVPDSKVNYRYVDHLMVTGNEVMDPFGNSFVYNPANGWVSSTTEGYTEW